MFKLSEIKELIKLVDQSSLQELEIENEGARLSIRKPNKSEPVYVSAPVQQTYAPLVNLAIQTQRLLLHSKFLHQRTDKRSKRTHLYIRSYHRW